MDPHGEGQWLPRYSLRAYEGDRGSVGAARLRPQLVDDRCCDFRNRTRRKVKENGGPLPGTVTTFSFRHGGNGLPCRHGTSLVGTSGSVLLGPFVAVTCLRFCGRLVRPELGILWARRGSPAAMQYVARPRGPIRIRRPSLGRHPDAQFWPRSSLQVDDRCLLVTRPGLVGPKTVSDVDVA